MDSDNSGKNALPVSYCRNQLTRYLDQTEQAKSVSQTKVVNVYIFTWWTGMS